MRSRDDDDRGANAEDLTKCARSRRGKVLRQGQRTLRRADAHARRQLRDPGVVKVVREEGKYLHLRDPVQPDCNEAPNED